MPIQNASVTMGTGISTTGAGGKVPLSGPNHAFQAVLTDGGGDNAATVVIQVSLDGTNWLDEALTLTFTDSGTEGGRILDADWAWARYNVTDVDASDSLAIYYSTGIGVR